MGELKERAAWCVYQSGRGFLGVDAAPMPTGRREPAPPSASDSINTDNLPQVAEASLAAMARAKAEARAATGPGTLVTFAEAMAAVHRLVGDSYPPHFALALSLDAAGVIAVSLLDAWDDARDSIGEGADLWCDLLAPFAYVEKCHAGLDGRALRLITRGTLPAPCHIPSRVQVQTTGYTTLTGWRISGRPAWRPDPGGVIADATEVLAYLCGERKPQYITR